MGTYQLACTLTHTPLNENSKTSVLLLAPNSAHTTQTAVLTETTSMYELFGFPMDVQLDEYGQVVKVTPSPTTTFLEKVFHQPAQAVINFVLSPHRSSDQDPILSAYNLKAAHIKKIRYQPVLPDESLAKNFNELGLTITSSSQAKEAYSHIFFDHESGAVFEGKYLKDDQYWFISFKTSTSAHHRHVRTYSDLFAFFAETLKIIPGIPKKYWSAVKLLQDLSATVYDSSVIEELNEHAEASLSFYPTREKISQALSTLAELDNQDDLLKGYRRPPRPLSWLETHMHASWLQHENFPLFVSYAEEQSSILEAVSLLKILTLTNHVLHPSVYSNSDTEIEISETLQKLASITDKLSQKSIERFEDNN